MNWMIMAVALQQIGAGFYSFYLTNWKVGAIMVLVGIVNCIMATVEA